MDSDYYGNDIEYLITRSAKECQFKCSMVEQCVGFTWSGITDEWVTQSKCHLKNAIPTTPTEYKGLISGPKYCGTFFQMWLFIHLN